jgi:hypothetical protein
MCRDPAERSIGRGRMSVSTNDGPRTQDERDADNRIEMGDEQFSSHTPSHFSRESTDKDDCSIKNAGPTSPGPWSQFGRAVGDNSVGDD